MAFIEVSPLEGCGIFCMLSVNVEVSLLVSGSKINNNAKIEKKKKSQMNVLNILYQTSKNISHECMANHEKNLITKLHESLILYFLIQTKSADNTVTFFYIISGLRKLNINLILIPTH